MSLIEGIGDEVTNFLIIVISATVLYFAWRSTNVRDDRGISRAAVLIIESNRRRLLHRVAQHPITILRSSSQHSNGSNDTDEVEIDDITSSPASATAATIQRISEPPSLQSILDEFGDLTSGATYPTSLSTTSTAEQILDTGPQEIIREMDRDDTDGLRRRQVTSSDNANGNSNNDHVNNVTVPIGEPSSSTAYPKMTLNHQDSTDKSENTDNCTNENSENGNVIENITLFNDTTSTPIVSTTTTTTTAPRLSNPNVTEKPTSNDNEFRIKLKYLNDDLKLVKGTPNEAIGDFKKRNFSSELSNQKIVRLVFNGHVLQPDSKTLQACGLFDNCVVHCLVHNQRPNTQPVLRNENDLNADGPSSDSGIGLDTSNENNEVILNNGQRLVYFGMFLLCMALGFLWYFRIQYFQLFTWYSTIGLFLLTALFLVIIPLVYLIERDITT